MAIGDARNVEAVERVRIRHAEAQGLGLIWSCACAGIEHSSRNLNPRRTVGRHGRVDGTAAKVPAT